MLDVLADEIRAVLDTMGDPERALEQRRYMKSTMPYRGIVMAELRSTVRSVVRVSEHRPGGRNEWERTIRALWDEASFREDRYAALTVARLPAFRRFSLDPESLALYEELVRSGAWWDLVDETAHLVGDLLAAHREVITSEMRRWSRDPDLWVRRVSIISQLGAKSTTDTELLRYCIEGSLADPDFFARKAIGWALRQYAYTDPDWVRAFVAESGDRLSPLSRREALKRIGDRRGGG